MNFVNLNFEFLWVFIMVMWVGIVQKERVLENKGGILKHGVLGRVRRACNRKPHILF
jgi:hypothetical protein